MASVKLAKQVAKSISNARAEEPAAEWVAIETLAPWARNPRRNDENVKRVVESIKRFGFAAPIVARRADGEIIAGHTRLKAAQALGMTRVPVRYMDLDPADAHLLALADNRLNELSPWDEAGLQELLGEMGLENAALAGWDSADLEKMGAELLVGDGELPDLGDEPTHTQMTFTLSHRQKAIVDAAIDAAKAHGCPAEDNDNGNGNALAAVCKAFNG